MEKTIKHPTPQEPSAIKQGLPLEKRLGGASLVLEGGGMRGMFTNGILDVLMEEGIEFDALCGVSAGILFGCNFKSKQPGRALRYNLNYKDEKHYMSWWSLFHTGNFVNDEFSFHTLPCKLDKFDFKTFRENPMHCYCVCTDIVEGKPVYHELTDAEGDGMMWMRASASMPFFAQPILLDDHWLLDGGITDSIPLEFMQKRGYGKNVVVLTQPLGYKKSKMHVKTALRLVIRKFPKVAELMSVRHLMYNRELDYIEAEARKGNTLVVCPDEPLHIGRLSMNGERMKKVYEMGRKKAQEMLPQLKTFMIER